MTDDRTADRIVDAWLDLMPSEAPDRAIAAVLQAVATTPQVRRWRSASWRPQPMLRLPYAIAAAVLVVAIGGAVLLIGSDGDQHSGGVATPSETTTPAASNTTPPAGGPIPAELQARWMGGPNDLVAAGAGSSILIDAESIELSQSNDNRVAKLAAQASTSEAGTLALTTSAAPCDADAAGEYDWSLSPSARVLTIAPVADACAQRGTAFAGTWWRMGCTIADDNCLGLLDAGTYKSQFISPRLDPGSTWSPTVGGLTYTVPAGWANSSDWPESFELVPATDLPPIADADRTGTIGVFTQPTAMTQDPPCSDQIQPGVGRTASDLAAWLDTVPGLVTTEPTPITIDGRSGQTIDLWLDPSWTGICREGDPDTTPIVTYLNPGLGVRGDERTRLILLDLGDGDVVAIGAWTRDQATFDAFVPEAMPVIESFRFE